MALTSLLLYSFMINLSIIIGFEEIESRSAFDVVAPWFPIYLLIFLALFMSLKILEVKPPRGFKLVTFLPLLLLKTQF